MSNVRDGKDSYIWNEKFGLVTIVLRVRRFSPHLCHPLAGITSPRVLPRLLFFPPYSVTFCLLSSENQLRNTHFMEQIRGICLTSTIGIHLPFFYGEIVLKFIS